MSWIGDLRDVLNFRQERKKRQLELEKLEQDGSRIRPANLEDVERYDPKHKALKRAIRKKRGDDNRDLLIAYSISAIFLAIVIAIVLLIVFSAKHC